jgi:hypothetical protein
LVASYETRMGAWWTIGSTKVPESEAHA